MATPGLDAEIFDIRSRSWSLGSPLGVNLQLPEFAAVAPTTSRRILVLTQPLERAFAYDVGADYWSRVTPPPHWGTSLAVTATLSPMANGQVLFLAAESAWLFDPNGNLATSDVGPGSETVVLSVIAGVLLLLIGVQAFFRGRRPVAGRGGEGGSP